MLDVEHLLARLVADERGVVFQPLRHLAQDVERLLVPIQTLGVNQSLIHLVQRIQRH
jgi:hypothetical protein